jgi:hypothetical protein
MGSQAYSRVKARSRARSAALVVAGQDIGALPPVRDVARRARADLDFRFFCESYFPRLFTLAWSDDHLKVIAKIELAVLHGGLFAMAMPRGSGKTTLCQTAALWALLTGRQPFVFLVAATAEYASAALSNLKSHLSQSELLLADYPEVVYPIRRLEGESRRCSGQRYYGQLTHVGWTADQIVLPTIPGSRCSGALVRTAGLIGNIRGAMHIRPDGRSVRPTLVVIDDPQTDQSARSPAQVHERLTVINGAILNLAGPGRRIAAVMPCTVIRNEDLADQILDRQKHPEWQGERTRLVYSFPSNEKLWAEYARIRAESLRSDSDGREATEFYRKHRAAMDDGAVVAWAARHNPDELSAIQHAMNLKLRDEAAFWAEYQNDPLPEVRPDDDLLTADQICAKVNGHDRRVVPIGCTHLTMFVDVQQKALFWLVAAWEDDFTGYVVDYGTEPDQKAAYFTLRDIRRTLATASPRAGLEGSIYAGLERLTDATLGHEWRRDDGAMVRIDRCLVDANWGSSTDVVYQFCRQSKYASVLMPSHGRYVGASSVPFSEYKRKRGDRVGLNWRIPTVTGKRSVRHAVFDTNYWKSFVQARLAVPMGDPGCLSLFGQRSERHRLIAEHLTAEYRVKTEGRGRTVDEWKLRADGLDNHWLDALVGAAVAASMQGTMLFGTEQKPIVRQRMRLSALQKENR